MPSNSVLFRPIDNAARPHATTVVRGLLAYFAIPALLSGRPVEGGGGRKEDRRLGASLAGTSPRDPL